MATCSATPNQRRRMVAQSRALTVDVGLLRGVQADVIHHTGVVHFSVTFAMCERKSGKSYVGAEAMN